MNRRVLFSGNQTLWILVLITLLTSILYFYTAGANLFRDDYMHRAMLSGVSDSTILKNSSPLTLTQASQSLFSFYTPDDDQGLLARSLAYGNVPWWTDPNITVNFWRPISAVTHWLDYQLWPDNPSAMHLHSIAWYFLACALFLLFTLRLPLAGWALGIAVALYFLDGSHAGAVHWLANRNIVVASCFGLLSLITLTYWSSSRFALIGAAFFYVLSLLSAEAAVGFFGLIAAYIVCEAGAERGKHSWGKRLSAALLFVVVTLVWRYIYQAQGYGVANSQFYIDPAHEFTVFINSLFVNGPILWYEQLTRIPALSFLMSPAAESRQALISGIVALLTGVALIPLLRRSSLARFALLGALLALPVACLSPLASGRLTFVFGIGVTIVIALWLAGIIRKAPWYATQVRGVRILLSAWAILLVLAMLAGTGMKWFAHISKAQRGDAKPFPVYADVLTDVQPDTHLILVNPPILFEPMYMPIIAAYFDKVVPQRMLSLVPGTTSFNLNAQDRTLVLSNSTGFMLHPQSQWPKSNLPDAHPIFAAHRADSFFRGGTLSQKQWQIDGITITVTKTNDLGDPTEIQVEFPYALQDPRYRFLLWDWSTNQYKTLQLARDIQIPGPFNE